MPRIVSPPRNQLNSLRQPLTRGEKLVFEFFDRYVPQAWEIYVQPHLNGLRPDFVLLNPDVGIAVFEVKDWDLEAMERWVERRESRAPELMGRRDGRVFSLQDQNPVEKVYRYRNEIEDLYCPRLDRFAKRIVVTAGVVFPFADDERARRLFETSRKHRRMVSYERYNPISGREALASGIVQRVFPEAGRMRSGIMKERMADDLRNWLVEPDVAAAQRQPLHLDENQRVFVTTRTETGYRRIKGPAGSGKSVVLAARAAQLLSEGKEVLVITFNITLLHYLMDLAVRWPHPGNSTRKNVTWLNFHRWCKRVCQEAGREDDYHDLWKTESASPNEENQAPDRSVVFDTQLPALVASILDEPGAKQVQLYDAILVDEGQDFLPEWWQVLRKICKPGGEMLLVADATQDTYGKAGQWPSGSWTEGSMVGSGFSGPWAKLEVSYRNPPRLVEAARDFAEQFLPKDLRDLPNTVQPELDLYPCRLRWVQTVTEQLAAVCVDEILRMLQTTEELSVADVTFLVDSNGLGRSIKAGLKTRNINTVDTFNTDSKEARKEKLRFYMGDARVKGTTLHSFKGWESRALVVCFASARDAQWRSLVYSGITRLKRHENGSFLSVVSAESALAAYGRTWPEFDVAGQSREEPF